MTFIIVGASAGLGRALTEKFASEGNDLIIISSELKDVDAIKCDLENRFNVEVFTTQMMFQKNEFCYLYILLKTHPLFLNKKLF